MFFLWLYQYSQGVDVGDFFGLCGIIRKPLTNPPAYEPWVFMPYLRPLIGKSLPIAMSLIHSRYVPQVAQTQSDGVPDKPRVSEHWSIFIEIRYHDHQKAHGTSLKG